MLSGFLGDFVSVFFIPDVGSTASFQNVVPKKKLKDWKSPAYVCRFNKHLCDILGDFPNANISTATSAGGLDKVHGDGEWSRTGGRGTGSLGTCVCSKRQHTGPFTLPGSIGL
jgi:hypothetical protein